jgi:hypothetical protein
VCRQSLLTSWWTGSREKVEGKRRERETDKKMLGTTYPPKTFS